MPRKRPARPQAREQLILFWLKVHELVDRLCDEIWDLRDAGSLDEEEAREALLSARNASDQLLCNRPRLSR